MYLQRTAAREGNILTMIVHLQEHNFSFHFIQWKRKIQGNVILKRLFATSCNSCSTGEMLHYSLHVKHWWNKLPYYCYLFTTVLQRRQKEQLSNNVINKLRTVKTSKQLPEKTVTYGCYLYKYIHIHVCVCVYLY